jgi:hypothetical protein
MTVKELIDALCQLPPDSPVCFEETNADGEEYLKVICHTHETAAKSRYGSSFLLKPARGGKKVVVLT